VQRLVRISDKVKDPAQSDGLLGVCRISDGALQDRDVTGERRDDIVRGRRKSGKGSRLSGRPIDVVDVVHTG